MHVGVSKLSLEKVDKNAWGGGILNEVTPIPGSNSPSHSMQ